MAAVGVALMTLLMAVHAAGQVLRTANGSLIMEMGGATLSLSGQASCGTASSAIVYQADMQSAIAAAVSQIQPQVPEIQ